MPKRQNTTAGGGFHKVIVNKKIDNAQRQSFANRMWKRIQSGYVKRNSLDDYVDMKTEKLKIKQSIAPLNESINITRL